jgi:3-dehydroquinate synthase
MNIILVGFMGSGKTVVGKEVAARLGMPFVDMDEVIEERHGRTISRIFSENGEAYFRKLEGEVVREIATLDRHVVATGGGVMLNADNVCALRSCGMIVCLTAEAEVIRARTAKAHHRPILEECTDSTEDKIRQLLRQRARYYGKADTQVNTSRASVSEVADHVTALVTPELLEVNIGPRSYPILIGQSLRDTGCRMSEEGLGGKVLLVSDTNVYPLYGQVVRDSLVHAGFAVHAMQVRPGERAKTLFQARRLYEVCLDGGLDRSSTVVALGGGVVGDLAGFVAATFMRGLNLVMIPTSLLSQVDSSVGGKVAVNLPRGKNLVGTFHQPRLVLLDPLVLRTLAPRRIREGLAEAIKCAVIADEQLFAFLEENISAACTGDIGVLRSVASASIKIKVDVVQADEREEKGIRQVLNLGHTVGHAIEATARYGRITHGEAVAIGMLAAFRIALKLDLCSRDSLLRVERLIAAAGLPTCAPGIRGQDIVDRLRFDKKARDGRLVFILPRGVGAVHLRDDVPMPLVREVVEEVVRC